MTPGKLIRDARERLQWTQTELAERVGVTPGFITKLEKDEALPGADLTLTLANLLLIHPEPLLRLVGELKHSRKASRRAQRARARGTLRPPEPAAAPPPGPAPPDLCADLGREIINNPDLLRAVEYLRVIFADPGQRLVALRLLEALAAKAAPES
jgi:transcriptional regulator with XRE-family HTH domain